MLKPASLFSDGAVLCRRKEIRIFGRTDLLSDVTVRLTGKSGQLLAENTAAPADGYFCVSLPPQEAQTGCRLQVCSDSEIAIAENVAIGDVYLAGGQSNMELELRNADEGMSCLRTHRDPLLRFFNVPKHAMADEKQRKAMDQAHWEEIAPLKGQSNSAVAYFFAVFLRRTHPEVPIGIIDCYWGGTSISCWLKQEELETLTEGKRYLTRYAELTAGKTMDVFLEEQKAFQETIDGWNANVERVKEQFPGISWAQIEAMCGICPWNPPAGPGSPYRPGGLAVSMLQEIEPVSLTGILYYQGEEDADKTERYDELMLLLIRSWRKAFRDNLLPFLFVQLPMWLDRGAEDTFRWPAIRLAQAAARDAARNTAMVCLLDEGEYGNIHPTAKRVVGERLHELAEQLVYGKEGKSSPRFLRKYCKGNTIIVELTEAIETRDGQAAHLLEIAGADRCFIPADAMIQGCTIELRNKNIPHPVFVRYAWTDYSDRVNLFGKNGLPVEPFSC